ncbi:hypothetical protein CYMTET_27315 [Cymbomonas tetramitiformis]|uniref:Mitochondrial carrier protein n=1 Tax=Cymbomonas tetramitiformis TaxID=36881 RepID=A0AAE0KX12_9CHLO|nr:hypothetical protein CYMTET_27315 [Cymbomonas tetramitiformis]
MATVLFVYPLELLSMRYSVTSNVYGHVLRAPRRIMVLEGGLGALYAGVIPAVLRALVHSGVQVSIFTSCYNYRRKQLLRERKLHLSYTDLLGCSLAASLVALSASMPLELIKCHMQVQCIGARQKRFTDIFTAIIKLTRENGISTLFGGLGLMLLRELPYTVLNNGVYLTMKSHALNKSGMPTHQEYDFF